MALSLLVGLLLAQGDATPKITFKEPAAPLSRILPELAKATNLPLKLGKAMPNYVIDIAVKDVTVKDLLQKVAEVTAGFWNESEHSFFLSPSDGARARITAEVQKNRAAALTESLKAAEVQKPTNKADADFAAFDPFDNADTGDAFFPKALAAIGVEQLATIQAGDRVVLSTKPLARQFQLPVGNEMLNAFVLRHNARSIEQMAKMKAQALKSGEKPDDFEDLEVPAISAWSKVDLSISRGAGALAMFDSDRLQCDLTFYDAKGKELGNETASLDDSRSNALVTRINIQVNGDPKQHIDAPEKPLELSPEAKQFMSVMMSASRQNSASSKKFPKATPEDVAAVKERNLRPDLYDPIRYAGDFVTSMAEAKNLQVVACLPDSCFNYFVYFLYRPPTPSKVYEMLYNEPDLICHEKDGWLTTSPTDFRITPIDRGDLSRMAQDLSNGTTPTIEWRAQAATQGLGDFLRGPLGTFWLTIITQFDGRRESLSNFITMLDLSDWDMLHLYGDLDDNQRSILANNQRLPISQMSDDARSLADRMIFAAQTIFETTNRLMVEVKPDKDSLFGPTEAILQEQTENNLDGQLPFDYRGEPTEVAPNGIPDQGALTVKEVNTDVLMPVYESRGGEEIGFNQAAMSPEELAGYVSMTENSAAQATPGQYSPPKITGVRLGKKRSLHFRIWVATDTFKNSTVDDVTPSGDRVYTLKNLPADLQKRYDSAKLASDEAYKNEINDDRTTVTGKGGVPR